MKTLKRILVPLDGSLAAEKALALAEALAQKFESEILLLHVIDLSPVLDGGLEPTLPFEQSLITIREWANENAASYLRLLETALCRQGITVRSLLVETKISCPSVAEEIVGTAQAHQVDLIVMAVGRHCPHWTLASVTEQALRRCPCPVLLIGQGNPANKQAPRVEKRSTARLGEVTSHCG